MTYNVNHTSAPAATEAADIDAVAEELEAAPAGVDVPFGALVDGDFGAFGALDEGDLEDFGALEEGALEEGDLEDFGALDEGALVLNLLRTILVLFASAPIKAQRRSERSAIIDIVFIIDWNLGQPEIGKSGTKKKL